MEFLSTMGDVISLTMMRTLVRKCTYLHIISTNGPCFSGTGICFRIGNSMWAKIRIMGMVAAKLG